MYATSDTEALLKMMASSDPEALPNYLRATLPELTANPRESFHAVLALLCPSIGSHTTCDYSRIQVVWGVGVGGSVAHAFLEHSTRGSVHGRGWLSLLVQRHKWVCERECGRMDGGGVESLGPVHIGHCSPRLTYDLSNLHTGSTIISGRKNQHQSPTLVITRKNP
eukprot:m.328096 g.328096  ORF g.328096 m.328096 type:complete len:166 (+) comp27686_c0_seq5:112-609(+)